MFRGDAGKWTRWGLGFLGVRVEGRGQQLEDVLEHVLELRLAPTSAEACATEGA